MRDKRPVDELSIEELERVLAIRKREARQTQLQRMKRDGRVVAVPEAPPIQAAPPPAAPTTNGDHSEPVVVEKPRRKVAPPPIKGAPRFEDEVEEIYETDLQSNEPNAAWNRFVNAGLLLVELAAVLGLLFLGYQLLITRADLQTESRAAQEMSDATRVAGISTLAPTPTLRLNDLLLPGGHVIENGVARQNFDEIDLVPARYRDQLRYEYSNPVLERPQPTDQTPQFIDIPAISIQGGVTQGTDWDALKQGVGQVINGYDPSDEAGNVVLAAHNDIYGELFRNLDQLQPGDRFTIRTAENIYHYEITHHEVVDPTDVWVMESQGRAMVTLISCYPHGVNNKRYVVFANRVDV